ncbi:hypothetical protein ABI_20660 [Asticcacaulis biprosthecium C19]|uniref:Uncharacterized protein n=1 Tax=Asticcacaulis biprosthecium C19 TaxID=715226 RepID=F4QM54_9CAUL|nr:hypothetical protein ABI_20660 [Asticcacaulis biprosthecium C19]
MNLQWEKSTVPIAIKFEKFVFDWEFTLAEVCIFKESAAFKIYNVTWVILC